MAKVIELPDGREAEFPDDMSNDAIAGVLQKQFPMKGSGNAGSGVPSSSPAAGAIPSGVGAEAGRQGKLFVRALANMAMSPVSVGGNALNKAINATFGTNLAMPGETINRALDEVLPAPQTGVERFTQEVAKSAPAFALPASVLPQALGNAAIAASQAKPGREAQEAVVGGAGGAAGAAAGPVLSAALRGMGNAAAHGLGMTTGAGTESVKQAWKGGPGFVENMRGKVDPSEVVATARDGLANMRQQMYDRYATAKGGWASDTAPLDFRPVAQAFNDAVGKFGFKGRMQPGAEEVMPKVKGLLDEWQTRAAQDPAFLTVEGLDALKRHLQDLTPDFNNRTGRAFVTEVVDKVKAGIVGQRPEYAKAMKDYWESSGQLDEIARSLSLTDKASTDTALRKLQSLMRNNVNTNYGQRLTSAAALEQAGANILPQVAGQALSSWTPRGLQGAAATGGAVANPAMWPALATFSPRLVGEAVGGAGAVMGDVKTKALLDALRRASPAAMRKTSPNGQGDE